MKNNIFIRKLISSIFITALLIYFMIKTTSPKIIFVPFLICSIAMIGKSIGLILDKRKCATVFDKIFKGGFLLFWFGFLFVACYISIKEKSYSLTVFSLPFWLVGSYFLKNKFLNMEPKDKATSKFNFVKISSSALVLVVILSGLVLLFLGIAKVNKTMIFAGAFFTFGAFAFILFGLTALGYFDKLKFDVLGMYVGILFVAIGIGIPALKYADTLSLSETVKAFNFWILIPIMLVVAGVLQIVKCLRNMKQ